MRNSHIINIRGLMMGPQGDGIEEALRAHETPPLSITTIAPTPPLKAREEPAMSVQRCFEQVQRAISIIDAQDDQARIVIIGRSFGAFLGLLAAIRLKFEKIAKVIMIEGPMNPNVDVKAPTALPMLRLCGKHYEERVDRALAASTELDQPENNYRSKLAMIQTLAPDAVVPNQSHALPGKFPRITYSESDSARSNIRNTSSSSGLVVKLSDTYAGRGTGLLALLPQEYQNHLEWSPEKMKAVIDIISLIA